MKKIVMMVAAGCAIGVLTGCGVPKEEHAAKVAELNDAWAEIETLKGKNADTESLLKAEQGKVRSTRIKLDDASKRIAELKEKEAAAVKALADEKGKTSRLESDLAAAKSSSGAAGDRANEAEDALATLQEEYNKLKASFEQFKKNMRMLDGESDPVVPASSETPDADDGSTGSGSKSALDLLDEMSNQ